MNNNQVNGEVLRHAFVLLYGEEALPAIIRTYDALNEAMKSAYSQGYQAAELDGAADAAALDEDQLQFEWDEGYISGVDEARRDPAEADRYVAFLVSQDDFDESNVSDTGDEHNPTWAAYEANGH